MLDIDDHYPQHPKLLVLGEWAEVAGWLNLAAIAWSARHLTDGIVPKEATWRLASFRHMRIGRVTVTVQTVVEKLLAVGMWNELDAEHYSIHDFLDYQESRDHARARRASLRTRQARHRAGNGAQGGPSSRASVTPAVTRDNGDCHALVTRDTAVTFVAPFPFPLSLVKKERHARDGEREREPETPFPATFVLDRAMAAEAAAAGCRDPVRAFAKFRAHALERDRHAANWPAAWASWCLRHDPTHCCALRRAPPRVATRVVDRQPSEPVALGAILEAALKTRGTP